MLELSYHPFRSKLYDWVEEFTTLTEYLVLLFGLVLSAGPDPDDWIEPLAWVFIGISFALVGFALFVDLMAHVQRWQNKALRARLNVLMSPVVFNLEFKDNLVINYLTQASEQQLEEFRTVEEAVIKHIIPRTDKNSVQELEIWSTLAASQPALLSWLTTENFKSSRLDQESNPAKIYVKNARNISNQQKGKLYLYFAFNAKAGGALLSWISDAASEAEMQAVRNFLSNLNDFHEQQASVHKTFKGKMGLSMFHSYYDKALIKKNEEWDSKAKEAQEQAEFEKTHAMRLRESARSFSTAGINVTQDAVCSQAAGYSAVEQLMVQLAAQMPCEYAMLIPLANSAILTEKLYAFNGNSTKSITARGIPAAEWLVNGKQSPAGLAVAEGKTVIVKNIHFDERFSKDCASSHSFSQLCVPLKAGGVDFDCVLKLVNKKTFSGSSSGMPFNEVEDPRIAKIYAQLMLAELGGAADVDSSDVNAISSTKSPGKNAKVAPAPEEKDA